MIHESAIIKCERFEIGKNSYIGPNVKITCKEFYAGDYLYIPASVEIGRGGCNGPNSIVMIGNGVGIFEGVVINPSEKVNIGDNVGIGAECLIWTHGAWLNPLEGYPASFASCSIGSNVWLPARSIMLPGTNIGDNVVIGTGSIITKDIPSGALAMGSPCKVIKENYYPKKLTFEEKDKILSDILYKWYHDLLPHKNANDCVTYQVNNAVIKLVLRDSIVTKFDTESLTIIGNMNEYAEDLRDFLRRNGIKFFTGKPFKSMAAAYESYH
jgi:acetyltransferase-like isoleucine patch superfamily enzyme